MKMKRSNSMRCNEISPKDINNNLNGNPINLIKSNVRDGKIKTNSFGNCKNSL